MESLRQIAQIYRSNLEKLAKKNGTTRTQVDRSWQKAKASYQGLKREMDGLQAENRSLQEKIDHVGGKLRSAQSEMNKWHNSIRFMDLADAKGVNHYENGDIGYLVDGGEFHLEMDENGDLKKVPLKQYRKDKRKEEIDELPSEDNLESVDDSNMTADDLLDYLDKSNNEKPCISCGGKLENTDEDLCSDCKEKFLVESI